MIVVHNDFPSIVGEARVLYLVQKLNSVPCCRLEIQTTPPHGYQAHVSAIEPILVVTMPRVAETFKTVIDVMTHRTNFKLVNLLYAETTILTHEDLNTSIDELDTWWSGHLVSYDTLTCRAKPSSNSQLSYCAWSFGIVVESYQYKTTNSGGWQIVFNATTRLKLHITGTTVSHSLYDWCYQTMWLCPGLPDDPEDDTVIE